MSHTLPPTLSPSRLAHPSSSTCVTPQATSCSRPSAHPVLSLGQLIQLAQRQVIGGGVLGLGSPLPFLCPVRLLCCYRLG